MYICVPPHQHTIFNTANFIFESMKTVICKALFMLLIVHLYTFVYAQPPHVFTQYTAEDGISQKTVNSILQDHKGNIWFATWDGIKKFDGYIFKNYKAYLGDLTGLTNNRIDFIAEDKYGYIWLLNYDYQVYRFNPQTGQFQPIPYNKYHAKSFSVTPSGDVWIVTEYEGLIQVKTNPADHSITAENFSQVNNTSIIESVNLVKQDGQGNQWILTCNGIYQLPPDSSAPITFFVENLQTNRNQKQPFYDMLEREKDIFFTSHQGRIWCYQKQGGRFSMMELPVQSHIISVDSLPGNKLFLGTKEDGFLVYDLTNRKTEHYSTAHNRNLQNNEIISTFVDSYKEVWIQLAGNGVTHFDPVTKEITYYVVTDKNGKELNTQQAFFIHEDIHRNLWIHPSGGGFSFFDREKKKLVAFYNEKLQSGWSSSNRMTASFSDKQGNLWLAASNNGIEKVTFKSNAFQVHPLNADDQESLDNEVRAIFEDSSGLIWVGSKEGIIHIYNSDMQFVGYLTTAGTISPTQKQYLGMAYSITQDHKGVIWIGTKGDGLISVTPVRERTYTVKRHSHHTSNIYSLSDNNVYCVYEDAKGRIWVATYGGGLNYVDYDKDNQLIFINHRNHLKSYPINQCYRTRFITSDYEGNIWVGTTTGILSFKDDFVDPERITFNHYTRIPGDIYSLGNNDVHNIYLTKKKELYIATFGGGLNKLISHTDEGVRFQSYTIQDGLPSDILLSIEEDTIGNLWIATEEEICKFTPETHVIENYTSRFFPLPFRFNEGASILTKSGKMMMNTNKGILTFNPDSIHKSSYVPSIVFSQLELGDKVISPGDESEILNVDIDDTSLITLSHKNNAFTLHYAALDMKYPADISYAYKLDGFEEEWNYVGKRRIATYTNLPKGQYTFLVKSTNSDGVWNSNFRLLSIRVLPSFWETPWAVLLYALVLIAVILTTVYVLFTFYRLKNEVTIEQKVSDLKLRFFTNISHELRTPLTLIAGPVEYILKNKELDDEVHEQLLLVEKNTSRMLRLVNQILDFRKIQNKKMKMQVQQIDVVTFVRTIMESFHAMADEQQIDFLLECELPSIYIWTDTDKLEKILFNLLSNAFKYTPRGKQIKVQLSEDDNCFRMSVQDQGIGIAESKQKSLFVRFENLVDKNLFNQPSSGIGLSLVKELVEMHQGKITIQSKPGEGSNFTVLLLKGQDHFDADTEFIVSDDITHQQESKSYLNVSPTQAEMETEPDTAKETLLLVEDNTELRFFLKTIFISHFNIIEAENGKTGLEKAREFTPDIIISDVMMPEMDGIEMMKELHADVNTSHIALILLTAKSNIESKIEGMELGADDYITKPFSAAYLKARIFNLLEQRKKLQALYCATLISNTSGEEGTENQIQAPSLSPSDQKFVDRLMELMDEHMDNGALMVEDLAASLSMSRSVFFKKLKSLIGLSPVEFVREVRMKRAAELIEEGGYNMAQIAYMVGFNDPHYFSKCFKLVFSMTPTEYKESKGRK